MTREETRTMRATVRYHLALLIDSHRENTRPADTVAALVSLIEEDNARRIIAAMVNVKGAWDQRISPRVRAWAAETAPEFIGSDWLYYADEIHPAHMDQIACEMMNYQPAPAEEPAAQKPAQPTQNPARVSISSSNRKMGAIPSVSLPPVVTCPRGVPCAAKCYAAKLCRFRPTVREAYARNLEILRADSTEYWRQVRLAASMTRYFRFHVSGDIIGADYFAEMVATAEALPGTEFLAFTKNYPVVNAWIAERGQLPCNLHLIFSEWGGAELPNPHGLPTAAVIFKGEEPRDGWKVCGGNCAECACRGVGCRDLKPGETIAFYEH